MYMMVVALGLKWGTRQSQQAGPLKLEGGPRPSVTVYTDGSDTENGGAVIKPCSESGRSVVVVVPVLLGGNREVGKLKKTLEAISNQSVKPDHIFLIDDGSPDPITKLLPVKDRKGVTIVRLVENSGPAAARNQGLGAARKAGAKFVCFTDSDCFPEPRWIESFLSYFETNPEAGIVTGNTKAHGEGGALGVFHDRFGSWNGRGFPDQSMLYGCTCNMALKLDKVEFSFCTAFREAAGEDVEFCLRGREKGLTIMRCAEAVVLHGCLSTLYELFKQYCRYGRSNRMVRHFHPMYPNIFGKTFSIPACDVLKAHGHNRGG